MFRSEADGYGAAGTASGAESRKAAETDDRGGRDDRNPGEAQARAAGENNDEKRDSHLRILSCCAFDVF